MGDRLMAHRWWGALALAVSVAALAAVACGGGGEEQGVALTLGDTTFSDHGTTNAAGKASLGLEADDFYFAPTFIQGVAGSKLTLEIGNESQTIHNFSLKAQGIDKDVPAGGKVTVEVTLPSSGVLLYSCKYHAGQGMNGELIAGTGAPAAPPV